MVAIPTYWRTVRPDNASWQASGEHEAVLLEAYRTSDERVGMTGLSVSITSSPDTATEVRPALLLPKKIATKRDPTERANVAESVCPIIEFQSMRSKFLRVHTDVRSIIQPSHAPERRVSGGNDFTNRRAPPCVQERVDYIVVV